MARNTLDIWHPTSARNAAVAEPSPRRCATGRMQRFDSKSCSIALTNATSSPFVFGHPLSLFWFGIRQAVGRHENGRPGGPALQSIVRPADDLSRTPHRWRCPRAQWNPRISLSGLARVIVGRDVEDVRARGPPTRRLWRSALQRGGLAAPGAQHRARASTRRPPPFRCPSRRCRRPAGRPAVPRRPAGRSSPRPRLHGRRCHCSP